MFAAQNNSLAIPSNRLGLSTSGTLFKKNGKTFTGIGVNHWGSFINEITNLGVTSDYRVDIPAIKQTYGLPFIRVCFGMYNRSTWYNNWYLNQSTFYSVLDSYVAKAESVGLGMIVNLAWDVRGLCDACYDIYGAYEPVKNLAYKHTKAWQLFANHVTTVVSRYKNSPSVWGWEIANEPATKIGAEYYYGWKLDGTDPVIGANVNWGNSPAGIPYPPTDKMSMAEYQMFCNNFVELVNSLDPHQRLISAGGALGNAFTVNAQTTSTAATDTLTQWGGTAATENLPWPIYRDNKFNTLTMHIYPQSLSDSRFFNGGELTASQLIAQCKTWADANNKPFWLAEWGATYHGDPVDQTSVDLTTETNNFNAVLGTIQSSNIQMSSAWNYGGNLAGSSAWMKWQLTDASRIYQLNAIATANAAMSN
jgi:hypothetical protein